MGGRKRCQIPLVLARARDRFESWRRKREPGSRIPEPLWTLAVELAGVHGLHHTASGLGLDYYSLKKRVEAAALGQQQATGPTFIELSSPVTAAKRCLFQLDNGAGATMRVQLVGYDAAEVAALSRSFWSAE